MTMAEQKKTRLPGELTFTVLLLLGSLFLLYQAYGISGFDSITSAGMFPMLSALVMAVTAFLALAGVAKAPAEPLAGGENLRQSFVRRISPPVFVLFALAVVAFMLLLNKLGFVVSAYLFLVVSMRLLGSVRWLFNLMLSAISLGVVYLIFQTIFSVILPKGTWWVGVWA
jgi:putative tricarboxylic transport membrane protein